MGINKGDKTKVRVIVADDHQIVRVGLRAMLEKSGDIEVVAEAANGRAAVEAVRNLSPDVVIFDISMPDLNGIEATRQIHVASPGVKVIALSAHSDQRFVVGMLEAGASAYLLKTCSFEELTYAIHCVINNQAYLSPDVANTVIKDYVSGGHLGHTASSLTNREREVLQLMAEGRNTKDIALNLNLSVKTVEAHRQRIMDRLNIHNVAELTKYAVREGLTPLE